MDNAHTPSHHVEPNTDFSTKAIWKTFRILLYITLFELVLAIGYYQLENDFSNRELVKHILNGVFIILTLAKAFFIVAEFMHLGHEIKNLIMTIVVPLLLFVWFIAAFLWDGNSYKNLRNEYDPYFHDQSKVKVEQQQHGHDAKKEHGAE